MLPLSKKLFPHHDTAAVPFSIANSLTQFMHDLSKLEEKGAIPAQSYYQDSTFFNQFDPFYVLNGQKHSVSLHKDYASLSAKECFRLLRNCITSSLEEKDATVKRIALLVFFPDTKTKKIDPMRCKELIYLSPEQRWPLARNLSPSAIFTVKVMVMDDFGTFTLALSDLLKNTVPVKSLYYSTSFCQKNEFFEDSETAHTNPFPSLCLTANTPTDTIQKIALLVFSPDHSDPNGRKNLARYQEITYLNPAYQQTLNKAEKQDYLDSTQNV